jgi:phosphate:Na+ symporter
MNIGEIIFYALKLLGTLALFLYGMKLISESLQKAAGPRLRSILFSVTSTKLKSLFSGLFLTAVIQSSSTTTVMLVGFVNAGLISLVDSIAVIFGANIGTTIKFWFINYVGFSFDISSLSLPAIGVGFLFYVFTRNYLKAWGEFVFGFGLLFLGLYFMKTTISSDEAQLYLSNFISVENVPNLLTILTFVGIGALMTAIMQSSSAIMALTLVLTHKGILSYELAVAMILGENIGTTITANIAALIANKNAKRTALAHFLINLLGVIIVIPLYTPFLTYVDFTTHAISGVTPQDSIAGTTLALCMAHTSFNVFMTILLFGFSSQIAVLLKMMIPDGKSLSKSNSLKHMTLTANSTSEIAVETAKNEVRVYAQNTYKMFQLVPKLLVEKDETDYQKLFNKIEHFENLSDDKELEIAEFLTKLTEDEISKNASMRISGMLKIIDNLESIADVCYHMAQSINMKNEQKCWFDQEMRNDLDLLFKQVSDGFDTMIQNLNIDYTKVQIDEAQNIENVINNTRDLLREKHLINLKEKKYPYQTGVYYSGLYASLEKIGDHIINVNMAIVMAKPHR